MREYITWIKYNEWHFLIKYCRGQLLATTNYNNKCFIGNLTTGTRYHYNFLVTSLLPTEWILIIYHFQIMITNRTLQWYEKLHDSWICLTRVPAYRWAYSWSGTQQSYTTLTLSMSTTHWVNSWLTVSDTQKIKATSQSDSQVVVLSL